MEFFHNDPQYYYRQVTFIQTRFFFENICSINVYMSVLENIHIYNPIVKSELIVTGQLISAETNTHIQHCSAGNT